MYVYMYTYIHTYIYIYKTLFICSSVDGHLSCCHRLATVNDAIMTWVCKYFICLGHIRRSGILDYTIVMFLRTCHPVYQSSCTTPISSTQEFQFHCILANTYLVCECLCVCVCDPNGCEVVLTMIFK